MNRAPHRIVRAPGRRAAGRLMALAGLALFAGLSAGGAGCSHPTGYVDLRSVLTPTGEGTASYARLARPLRITREISERSALLEVRVERLETTTGPARLERFGKPTWVPWHWYHPLVKLPVAVTIFPPFFLAFHDPTAYGGGEWTRWDYFHDVGAWFNLCSAVPSGGRVVRTEEERILLKDVVTVISQRRAPVVGRAVTLSLDGRELARGVSDAEGAVQFDLAPFLTAEKAQADHLLRIVSLSESGEEAELLQTLEGATVRRFIENRSPAPQPAPSAPSRP